ncbi:uncharacterized protein N7529_003219 [Penicillium soppii]|uniref:uncharacterized protein n=1 Tax=Penicillium soppii TaxID=69789 RepID=UPI00254743AC|nr:uncharacterized protein N7529_003219 [Penicillium soppii]KAJ5874789.1 hypothetical protein N7529_003219 [Penicillium soppii]
MAPYSIQSDQDEISYLMDFAMNTHYGVTSTTRKQMRDLFAVARTGRDMLAHLIAGPTAIPTTGILYHSFYRYANPED